MNLLRLAPVAICVVLAACGSEPTTLSSGPDSQPGDQISHSTSTTEPALNLDAGETAEEQRDFVVWLHAASNAQSQAAVEDALAEVYDEIVYVSQEETLPEFLAFFPDVEGAEISDMPPSFRVFGVAEPNPDLRSHLETLPAVRSVVISPTESEIAILRELDQHWAPDPRLDLTIVYLNSDAGEEGKAEVARLMADVDGIYFVDQEQTLDEFWTYLEGEPRQEGLEVTASQMPPSWRVDLDGAPLDPELVALLESNPHVRNVFNAPQRGN